MINEPKDAVRAALAHAVTGSTSGSWLSADPRPGMRYLKQAVASRTPEQVYDIMLDAVERGQADAKSAAHDAQASILYDLERIASQTDSHALHVYAEELRAKLYPKEATS